MHKKTIDTTLVLIVLLLVICGMTMISSVSAYSSFKYTSRLVANGILSEASNSYYFGKNVMHMIVGIFCMTFFSKLSYVFFEKYVKWILVGIFGALTLVLVIGSELNGARGWIDIPGLPSIQPVEFVKIGLIVYLAYFMKKRKGLMGCFQDGFLPFFLVVGGIFLLLALQPDFGSVLIIAPVTIAMYFVGGGNVKYLLTSFLICFIGAFGVYQIGKIGQGDENSRNSLNYIASRIDNFFQSNEALFARNDDRDYQTKQGLIAIGSGGFFGLGFGKSIQKYGYLPEVQGDFVFSVIVEELGFVGALVLMLAYLTIVYKGYQISRGVKDPFGRYLAFGIVTLILVQVFVNVGVNLNVVPLTGVTLPFVSYGGSSLITMMIAIGILLNISRFVEYDTYKHGPHFGKNRSHYTRS